jgi:polysaccharide deacetylase 2 family uncharacterized protein YibQ
VAADDLSAPLGQDKPPRQWRVLPRAIPRATAGLLSLLVVAVAGWAMVADDPFGGEPFAVVSAGTPVAATGGKEVLARPPNGQPAKERANRSDGGPPPDATPAAEATAGRTITIIDGTSGKRQDVLIPLSPQDGKPGAAIDQRVTELSPNGPLPRVGADGTRPADIYARPVKLPSGKPNAPRIAIVVGGLGIGGAVTSDALGKLPAPVTLAFAPYGGGLEQLAARARNSGHEVLLQVPMEPFDYPDNDPGPQTLLTSLDAGQNIDRLQWVMSRFQGYVGVTNFTGARFTASEGALTPVLREIGRRGLIYLDDSSSQRSVASNIAAADNLLFAKGDITIDAVPTPTDVDRALSRLETIARERGVAVGVAGALPVSIERTSKWAKAAEGRGVLLVPISAVAKQRAEDRQQTTENNR